MVQFPVRNTRARGIEDKRNAQLFFCTQNMKELNQQSDREEKRKSRKVQTLAVSI